MNLGRNSNPPKTGSTLTVKIPGADPGGGAGEIRPPPEISRQKMFPIC